MDAFVTNEGVLLILLIFNGFVKFLLVILLFHFKFAVINKVLTPYIQFTTNQSFFKENRFLNKVVLLIFVIFRFHRMIIDHVKK